MNKKVNEPLLTENPNRYVMFPVADDDIWKMYKKMMDSFWRAEEIDFSKDVWEASTGWLKKATTWIKGKLSSAWRWTMDRLRSVKDRLSKKDSEE